MPCSKCGESGHYASTCGRKAKAKARPARPAKKAERAPAASAPAAPAVAVVEGASVLDAMRIRREQLQAELQVVDQKRRELKLIESTIEELEKIGGGA